MPSDAGDTPHVLAGIEYAVYLSGVVWTSATEIEGSARFALVSYTRVIHSCHPLAK